MIARAGVSLAVTTLALTFALAFAIVACASIDPPAEFVRPDADLDPSLPDGSRAAGCGRALPRIFTADTPARIYGAPGGPQAVCMTFDVSDEPAAGPGLGTSCVFGDLDDESSSHAVGIDPATCTHCVDVRTNCRPSADAGVTVPCATEYLPTAGRMRIVRLSRDAGADVWIDVGGLVLRRVTERDLDAGTFRLEPASCLFADGLTLQGKLVAGTCADDDPSVECQMIRLRLR